VTEPPTSQANEVERGEARVVGAESADPPGKVPLTARLLLHESLTARRAAGIIAAFTVVITVAGGLLERFLDHQEYPTIGRGLWFALQTVTTVGYGDVTPKQAVGRFIAAVVMLSGIGFLAVITASVTASLVESSRRRFAAQSESDATQQFDEIGQRLARIEHALDQQAPGRSPDAAS
jgi:voltage-gated potassium channel